MGGAGMRFMGRREERVETRVDPYEKRGKRLEGKGESGRFIENTGRAGEGV
jgi:hypothetical protein